MGKGQSPATPPPGSPDVSASARVLAEQFILMAKAEALEKFGENREAENLAERVLRAEWDAR